MVGWRAEGRGGGKEWRVGGSAEDGKKKRQAAFATHCQAMNDCGGKENFCKSFSTSTLLLNYPSSPGLLALLLNPFLFLFHSK